MTNILNQDYQEFIKCLNKAEARYVLVGGYSVIFHGHPRTTGDLDLFVDVDDDNYDRLLEAFGLFGLHIGDMTRVNFCENDEINVFYYGRPPVSIEILKSISGVDFKTAFDNSIDTKIDGIPIRVIHLRQLRNNKEASGRHKDLDDLENLPSAN